MTQTEYSVHTVQVGKALGLHRYFIFRKESN